MRRRAEYRRENQKPIYHIEEIEKQEKQPNPKTQRKTKFQGETSDPIKAVRAGSHRDTEKTFAGAMLSLIIFIKCWGTGLGIEELS